MLNPGTPNSPEASCMVQLAFGSVDGLRGFARNAIQQGLVDGNVVWGCLGVGCGLQPGANERCRCLLAAPGVPRVRRLALPARAGGVSPGHEGSLVAATIRAACASAASLWTQKQQQTQQKQQWRTVVGGCSRCKGEASAARHRATDSNTGRSITQPPPAPAALGLLKGQQDE